VTHALVIGAGVAGPVAAVALQRAGIEATVFERDPAGAEQRGSWITSQCLRDCPAVPAASATFESLRRGRVEKIVRHGARSASSKAAGPVGRVIRDLILPAVFSRAARDGGKSMTWLQGHHIGFDQPVMPAAR
jgi:2-polyprenyl-6-methoxyphenol hydroxylase-like FAD-dependent oxidoreductase